MGLTDTIKAITPEIKKDALKKLFWGISSSLVVLFTYGIAKVAGIVAPTDFESARNFIVSLFEILLSSVKEYPVIYSVIFLILAVAVVFFYLSVRANRQLRTQGELLKGAATYKALVDECGIQSRWPHAARDGTGAPWELMSKEISHNETTFLCILGANGVDTFSGAKAPLNDAITNFKGQIRVILSHPDSKETAARAKAVSRNPNDYRKSIRSSMRFLSELKKQSRPVEARYYDGQPNWKLIITNRMLWLQYYMPGGPDVEKTAVYIFSSVDHRHSFYSLFLTEFNRIWARCASHSVNLGQSNANNGSNTAKRVASPIRN